MTLTSAALPAAATASALGGWFRHSRRALRRPSTRAVLFDCDGTLVVDVPYNRDPALVHPQPGARAAVARCRAAGLEVGVITNASAIGRGLASREEIEAVHARAERIVGPVSAWVVCPHAPEDGCACRKPRAGLVLEAARRLGVRPEQCVVVGDIGSDVEAAVAAGARAVLVPTERTLRDEVLAAPAVAPDLARAVELIVEGRV